MSKKIAFVLTIMVVGALVAEAFAGGETPPVLEGGDVSACGPGVEGVFLASIPLVVWGKRSSRPGIGRFLAATRRLFIGR